MTKFEFRINTKVGDLIIHFDTPKEFEDNLNSLDLEPIINAVKEKLGRILAVEPRQPKPGFEDVYRLTDDGYIELLKVPTEKIDTIGLVLFAYDPYEASLEQVTRSSRVPNASVYMAQPSYQKYFERSATGYAISQVGKLWILNDVAPKLRPQPKIS
jgi:hypothetical protein